MGQSGINMKKLGAGMRGLALVLALLVLPACAEMEFLIHSAKRISGDKIPDEPGYKIGEPYQIQGIWYYPAENYEFDKTGIASWYGVQFHGRRTANGEIYDMNALTAAHRTLPMPSFVRVTNLENGRSLILKVNDRGPFARGRIIDISRRGAQLLGFHGVGTARVRVQIMADKSRALAARMRARNQLAEVSSPITVGRLPKPEVKTESLAPPGGYGIPGTGGGSAADEIRKNAPVRPLPPRPLAKASLGVEKPGAITMNPVSRTNIFVQAGAYSHFDNANKARARLSSVGPVKVTSVLIKGRDLFRVRVGPISTVKDADRMLERVTASGYPDARIVVD